MVGFCERILAFTKGTGRTEFPADAMLYDAGAQHRTRGRRRHPRTRIGSTGPPGDSLARMIIATRNQLIHGYDGIDDDVLWSIVQTDIPALLASLRILKTQEPG